MSRCLLSFIICLSIKTTCSDSIMDNLAAKYGLTATQHAVTTDDGYILQMFRIGGSNCTNTTSPPVLMVHGLFLDSASWLDNEAGLARLVVDSCRDVWLGNVRGNYYGRQHTTLSPEELPFWQFSVDEMGYYDIPAQIDFVLNSTGVEQLNYIGYSQGCGSFYIMCDQRPGYCEKARLKISLAPATRHLNTKGIGFRYVPQIVEAIYPFLYQLRIYELLSRGGILQSFLSNYCPFPSSYPGCELVLAFVDALNPGSISAETITRLYNNCPVGTSVQNTVRYGQAMRSQEFVKYSYGPVENLKRYGSAFPPAYNLSSVTVPTVVIYGLNDGIVDPADATWAAGKLGNLLEAFPVPDPLFTHFDQFYHKNIPNLTYPKVIDYLNMYSD